MSVEFDRDEGAEHNEVRREWEEFSEGEVQENILDDAARAEFSEEEEEGCRPQTDTWWRWCPH